MSAPERIWADARTCTVYMDGSSPITASTREFRNSTEYTRSDLVAELAAENERLIKERDYWKAEAEGERAKVAYRDQQALSRTGAVKVKALDDLVQIAFDAYIPVAGECPVEPAMEAAVAAILSALEPAAPEAGALKNEQSAPEGQQPVACWPAVDLGEKAINGATIAAETQGLIRDPLQKYVTLEDAFPAISAARPSEQAVTEAMELARAVLAQSITAGHNVPGPTPEDIEKAFWALDAALKAAMEAGR